MSSENIEKVKEGVARQKKGVAEMSSFIKDASGNDSNTKQIATSHINDLKNSVKMDGISVVKNLEAVNVPQPLISKMGLGNESEQKKEKPGEKKSIGSMFRKRRDLQKLEKETLKRIKQSGEKEIPDWLLVQKAIVIGDELKASSYVRLSNRFFSRLSFLILKRGMFKNFQEDLIKSGMNYLPRSYLSMMFLTTSIAFMLGFFTLIFFLFFDFGAAYPFVTRSTEPALSRLAKTFWILFLFPAVTFFSMYFYPSTEKNSLEKKINQELPFATINMAAISGSMIDPTKIFSIIVSTKEYPTLQKEFLKIINGVNVMGYDLVTILRDTAFNSPSKKLRDLFNGLATTISSGGDMSKFFDERSKTLLFDYNLEKEKSNRAAETFMDIYISVVIAAPMILMLLLIIMQVSGLGLSLSTASITLLVVAGVTLINIAFLSFLHIKQQNE